MKICAIISEFNPFHNGHKYLIDKVHELGYTHKVAIMSGNFVQRGEPAIISKKARTLAAMKNGINLVIEIPTVWAISTSEKYAKAGITIADSLGCVDALVFGSESGDLKSLKSIAEATTDPKFSTTIKKYISTGVTFAKAREQAVRELLRYSDISDCMQQANNNLAIEYIKNLNRINSSITPVCVKRSSAENIISASEIRNLIHSEKNCKNYLPKTSEEIIFEEIKNNLAPTNIHNAEKIILYKLKSMSQNDFKLLPDISEGLENRFIRAVNSSKNFEEILFKIKTKRYTMSRIKRIIMAALLDIKNQIQNQNVPYIRILGSDEKGFEILNAAKHPCLPIISKYSEIKNLSSFETEIFEKECFCTNIYGLFLNKTKNFKSEQQFRLLRG